MQKLESIAERIRRDFDARTAARDKALATARQLTRACSLAIRAAHRLETDTSTRLSAGTSTRLSAGTSTRLSAGTSTRLSAGTSTRLSAGTSTRLSAGTSTRLSAGEMAGQLSEARSLADALRAELQGYPDLFHAGYTQDALKEFVEANATCALIQNQSLPTPEELGVGGATYLNGLAEVVGELRRRTLDILRHGYSQEAERLLGLMDDIYGVLVSMDYPDAITSGLRRQTDVARSIIEKTRGDITFSLRGEHLEQAIGKLIVQLNGEQARVGKEAGAFVAQGEDD